MVESLYNKVVTSVLESLFNKVAGLQASRPTTLLKKDSNTVFSCEYCEIFKSTCFEEHLPPAASVNYFVKLINDRYAVENKISLFSNFQNPPDISKIFE